MNKEGILRAALKRIAGHGVCQRIFIGSTPYHTCLEEAHYAFENPDKFGTEYREILIKGGRLCKTCIALEALKITE